MTSVLMIDASDRGGIADYTARLVADLRAAGCDVTLCAPPTLPSLPWGEEVRDWHPLRLRAVSLLAWTRRVITVRSLVRKAKPDVVHLQTAFAGPFEPALLGWLRTRAVVIRTIHNAVAHDDTRAGRREHALWRAADHLVVHGRDAAAIAEAAAGRPVHVIAADLPTEVAPTKAEARTALGVGDGPVALLLGLLRPYKGLGLLADAWPSVRVRVPAARLVVAGSVLEPFADLDRLVALDGVEARIGWLSDDDVLAWSAAADIGLLPYAHGAHSAVLHRAVVAGTPVLASPALEEEVDRLVAGRVVPLAPSRWADAMVDALTTPLPRPVASAPGQQAAATAALHREAAARRL
jgi:glycosyltransferase involved in cell wall biosynthesis